MDDLAREILETIDTYRKRGVNERWPETGEAYISVKFSVPGFEDDAEVRIPDPEFCQPSVDFEKEYGLQGLSGQHRLPDSLLLLTGYNRSLFRLNPCRSLIC